MNIKPALVQHLKSHSETGTWTGETYNGKPVISISGEFVSAEPYLTLLGIKLHNSNKYRGIENEDLGQPQPSGDSPELGDGTSQSAE